MGRSKLYEMLNPLSELRNTHLGPHFWLTASIGLLGVVAMTLKPFAEIETEGVWKIDLRRDPIYPLRVALVFAGLISGFASLGLTFWSSRRRSQRPEVLRTQIGLTLCIFVVGWAAFPYWANGVFRYYVGQIPDGGLYLFDPSALIPAIWLGVYWDLAVFLLLLCFVVMAPLLLLASIIQSVQRGSWKQTILLAACILTTASISIFSPYYFKWLAD